MISFRGEAQACRCHGRLDAASLGVHGWEGLSRGLGCVCVPDRASAVLVRDKKTRRHNSCGSPVPRRLPGYRPPNLRRDHLWEARASSVTLVN